MIKNKLNSVAVMMLLSLVLLTGCRFEMGIGKDDEIVKTEENIMSKPKTPREIMQRYKIVEKNLKNNEWFDKQLDIIEKNKKEINIIKNEMGYGESKTYIDMYYSKIDKTNEIINEYNRAISEVLFVDTVNKENIPTKINLLGGY